VLNEQPNFSGKEWKSVSKEARELVQQLLVKDPNHRISIPDALEHPWFKRFLNSKDPAANEKCLASLTNLKNFNANSKLQQAVAALITTQLTSVDQTKELREAFMMLDDNKDGRLSKEELSNGFEKVFGYAATQEEVNEIFAKADSDNSGFIDYNEFIAATINKKKLFSVTNLTEAFKMFDKDGNGSVSIDEIKAVIGPDLANDDTWTSII
jgi:calcium-dependent protein kinase